MKPASWQLRWFHTYTQPPDGKPRLLAEHFYDHDSGHQPPPPWMEELRRANPGYGLGWGLVPPPYEPRLSQEGRAKLRRGNLRKRMAKFPMFAEQFAQEQLDKRPDYYDGSDNWRTAEQREALARHVEEMRERYERALKALGAIPPPTAAKEGTEET